jgi:dCTP deaminase
VIVSRETLQQLIATGEVVVDPLDPEQMQPASIDLTLGTHFLKVDENSVDRITLDSELRYLDLHTGADEEIVIPPLSFLLAVTRERIRLPANMTAFVEGRSSIGRIGLFIQNAGWVDPGFDGTITLELFNANRLPIRLRAGRRICQIVFAQLDRNTSRPYQGKYQHQSAAVGSRIHLDTTTDDR